MDVERAPKMVGASLLFFVFFFLGRVYFLSSVSVGRRPFSAWPPGRVLVTLEAEGKRGEEAMRGGEEGKENKQGSRGRFGHRGVVQRSRVRRNAGDVEKANRPAAGVRGDASCRIDLDSPDGACR